MKTTAVGIVLTAWVALGVPISAQQPPPPAKPDHMHHSFDDPAKYAKSFDDPARDAWQMPVKIIDALGLKNGMAVADIGAGTGYFTIRLAKTFPGLTVYAVDIQPAMLEHVKNRAASEHAKNVVTVLANAASTNLPKAVDLALIVDTYHHLPNRVSYFREMKKSLTASGRVAIVDFRKDSPEGPPVEFRFTAEQIEDEMRQAGFRLDVKHDFLPRQHFLVFR